MNLELQRFSTGVDKEEYNKANPPSMEIKPYQIATIKAVESLMESFTRIEQGLARTIVTATGLNVPGKPEIWKPIVRNLGKNFTTEQQIRMVEDLIEAGALRRLEPLTVTLPNGFSKRELPYFQACRLAMNYRNELAHNWFIFLITKNDEEYLHTPMIGMDNPRAKDRNDIFIAANIASSEFIQWAYSIANRLPISLGTPAIMPTDTPVDAVTFFEKHKGAVISQLENAKAGKVKSISKFIASITTVED